MEIMRVACFSSFGTDLIYKTIGHRKEKARLTILASLIHDKLAKVFEHFNVLYISIFL